MSIALSESHLELAEMARSFLADRGARAQARGGLEREHDELPSFFDEMVELGWLGMHLPEEVGGAGFTIAELVVVIEQMGAALTPGPLLGTVTASSIVERLGSSAHKNRWLTSLATGVALGTVAFGAPSIRNGSLLSGEVLCPLGAHRAQLCALIIGDHLALIDLASSEITVTEQGSFDPSRHGSLITFRNYSVPEGDLISGVGPDAAALARILGAAEAAGVARRCLEEAVDYAKVREQFGRVIGTFQAVKHHCANMLVAAELATAAVYDAAQAVAAGAPADQVRLAAAAAAAQTMEAAVLNAELNVQVHGGIGFTWEHDAQLFVRRAVALAAYLSADWAARDVASLRRAGVVRTHGLELPAEAEHYREPTRSAVAEFLGLEGDARRARMLETGYVMPHWPAPYGREASALEQLVIEQEFEAAGLERPEYGITGWVILTIIQHGTEEQVGRWVQRTLEGEWIWCQLFSEPDAGSDAAAVRTKGEKVDGGWIVTGQKVWTSGAHYSRWGFATVRTDPTLGKHGGMTMMVIDMESPEVEIRPLRQATGGADFNEVFLKGVFVSDDDVVGPVDNGWAVARATLGNERVSIGGGSGGGGGIDLVDLYERKGYDDPSLALELGYLLAERMSMTAINLRSIQRAVIGSGPGPEGNVTKLLTAEAGQRAARFARRVVGVEAAFGGGDGEHAAMGVFSGRAMSIAGGTSEITRNQIAERILGLPRDPLLSK